MSSIPCSSGGRPASVPRDGVGVIGAPSTVHDPDLSKDRIDNRPDIAAAFLEPFRDKGIIRTGPVDAFESWLMGAGDFVRVLGELLADGITIYDRPV